MKKHRGKPIVQITDPEIDRYSENHTTPESEALKELIKSSDEALEYIDMLSGRIVGQFLKMMVQISKAKRILEIGTFTGYSALMMAEALPEDGEMVTLEMNYKYQEIAQNHFDSFPNGSKIKVIKGNAQKTITTLEGEFDMVYLDGDKLQYEHYYGESMKRLKQGGLIIADNVLWDGMVLDPEDSKSRAIKNFNALVAKDERVEQVLLPVRDGVSVIRKK